MSQGGLARSRRTVEDERHEPIGLDRAPEEPAGAENMLLTNELGEFARPHSPGKRRGDRISLRKGQVLRVFFADQGIFQEGQRGLLIAERKERSNTTNALEGILR